MSYKAAFSSRLCIQQGLVVVVLSVSRVRLSATPWTTARQAPLFFTISQSLLKLTSIESMMPSNHLILCRPLLLLPSIFPSIRVFSSELALCIRWPKLDYDLEQQRQGKSGSRITSPFWSLDDNTKWTECASDVSHQRRSRVSTLPQVHLPRGWPATWPGFDVKRRNGTMGFPF